ncbi:hypothetical protein BV20DRAFT_971112 [Pilatotrama ljubarskyi]|nr:hypothetical protein BV20DRAFT_971112 [Pilatotrama ljubarskyi]
MDPSNKASEAIDKVDRRRPIVLRTLPPLSFSTPTHTVNVRLSFRPPTALKPFQDQDMASVRPAVLSDVIRGASSPRPPSTDRDSGSSEPAESIRSFPELEDRVVTIEDKLKKIETSVKAVETSQHSTNKDITEIKDNMRTMDGRMQRMERTISNLPSGLALKGLEEKLKKSMDNKISNLQQTFDQTLEAMRVDFNGKIDGLRDELNGRMDELDGRIDGLRDELNGRMDELNGRMDEVDGRIDELSGRMDAVEGELRDVKATIAGMERKLDKVLDAILRLSGLPKGGAVDDLSAIAATSSGSMPSSQPAASASHSSTATTSHLSVPYTSRAAAASTSSIRSRMSARSFKSLLRRFVGRNQAEGEAILQAMEHDVEVTDDVPPVPPLPQQQQSAGGSSSHTTRPPIDEPIARPDRH